MFDKMFSNVASFIIRNFSNRAPDFIIGGDKNSYLKRWWVIPRNKFFNIYLHEILRPDDDRALHDHPWHNVSLILRNGYMEKTVKGDFWRKEGSITFRTAQTLHRLMLPIKQNSYVPCWSLFITGPRFREWGFQCPQGWIHWSKFTNPENKGEVGKGCNQ